MKKGIFWAGVETTYGTAATSWWPFPLLQWVTAPEATSVMRGQPFSLNITFPLVWTEKLPDLLSMVMGEDGARRSSYSLIREHKWGIEKITGAVPVSYTISGSSWSGEYLSLSVDMIARARTITSDSPPTFTASEAEWAYGAQGQHARCVLFDDTGGVPAGMHDFSLTVSDPEHIAGPADWDGNLTFVDSRTRVLEFEGTFAYTDAIRAAMATGGVKGFKFYICPGPGHPFYLGIGTQTTLLSLPFVLKTNDLLDHAITAGNSCVIRSIETGAHPEGEFVWGGFVGNPIRVAEGYYTATMHERDMATYIMGYGSTTNWVWYQNAVLIEADRFQFAGSIVDGGLNADKIQLTGRIEPDGTARAVY